MVHDPQRDYKMPFFCKPWFEWIASKLHEGFKKPLVTSKESIPNNMSCGNLRDIYLLFMISFKCKTQIVDRSRLQVVFEAL